MGAHDLFVVTARYKNSPLCPSHVFFVVVFSRREKNSHTISLIPGNAVCDLNVDRKN